MNQFDIQKYLIKGEDLLNDEVFFKEHKNVLQVAEAYLLGKEVKTNKELSYKLVTKILDATRREFIDGKRTLYPEVAFMYAYLRELLFSENDSLSDVLRYYLESREALKLRGYNDNDKRLSFELYKMIKTLKEELKLKTRKIKNNGYLVNRTDEYWSASNIKITKESDELYLVTIVPLLQEFVFGVHEEIYYFERVNTVQYLLSSKDNQLDKLLEKKITSIEIEGKMIDVCLENDIFLSFYNVDEVIYIPQNISSLDRKFTIISAISNDDEELLLVSEKKLTKEQILQELKGRNLTLSDVDYVYEDEVPLGAIKL